MSSVRLKRVRKELEGDDNFFPFYEKDFLGCGEPG
jgi:hypothetical protein